METKILVAGVKRQQMEETLKEEIRSGVLKPGETLPTYDRLGIVSMPAAPRSVMS